MKVAVYSGEIPSTTFIERLICGLAESGVEVVLHGRTRGAASYAAKVSVIGYRGIFSRTALTIKFGAMFLLRKPGTFFLLLKCFPQRKFSRQFVEWFSKAAPVVWHEPDIFHLQWVKAIEDWIFLRRFGIKLAVSLRGSHVNYSPVVDHALAESYQRSFPQVDGFHCVSNAIGARALIYGADKANLRTIYSGLDLDEFSFDAAKTINRETIEIISAGRPHWVKGYNYALDAMKILKDRGVAFHYRIVGGADEELTFQIDDLGLWGSVTITERVSAAETKALIAASDVLLLTSVDEGVPNVVLEAMALGTLVVATDCGGVTEVVRDRENGFVAPIRKSERVAGKIVEILQTSDQDLSDVRRRARRKIEQQHERKMMVAEMKEFYLSVLSGQPPALVSDRRDRVR